MSDQKRNPYESPDEPKETAEVYSAADKPASDRAFFGHPAGLFTLFFAEMWERFSYYGMRAILLLFMVSFSDQAMKESRLAEIDAKIAAATDNTIKEELTAERKKTADTEASGGLGFRRSDAAVVLALYTSLVYFAGVAGGWLADNIFGLRRAVFVGGVIIMLGHIALAFHGLVWFFTGLALVIAGTGLLKPNISGMVGLLYDPKDTRRDAGFSIYYMGVNTGSFLGQTVCGFLAKHPMFKGILANFGIAPENAWHFGFAAAAVGMFLGLVVFIARGKLMGDAGARPSTPANQEEANRRKMIVTVGGIAIAAIIGLGYGLYATGNLPSAEVINLVFGAVLLLTTGIAFSKIFFFSGLNADEFKRMLVVFILFFASVLFWGAFEQAAGSLNLFADEKSATTVVGLDFPAPWYQNINPFLIIILSPFFAAMWLTLGSRAISSPAKFSVALLLVGIGFAIAAFGSNVYDQGAAAAKATGGTIPRLSFFWLFFVYAFHTVGELFLSPIGLSMVTKLSPQRVLGQVMSIWFLSNANANFLAHQTIVVQEKFKFNDTQIFTFVAIVTMSAALVFAIMVKPIRKLMGGVH